MNLPATCNDSTETPSSTITSPSQVACRTTIKDLPAHRLLLFRQSHCTDLRDHPHSHEYIALLASMNRYPQPPFVGDYSSQSRSYNFLKLVPCYTRGSKLIGTPCVTTANLLAQGKMDWTRRIEKWIDAVEDRDRRDKRR